MAALLGIVANAMFLDAYGSDLAARHVHRDRRRRRRRLGRGRAERASRFDLLRIALAVLGAAAVILLRSPG